MGAVSVSPEASGEVVSAWVEAFNARDLDGMLGCLDRRVKFHPLRLTGLEASYRGHDGVRRWFDQLEQLSHEYLIEVDDLHPTREASVVVVGGSLRMGQAALAPVTAVHSVVGGQILVARHYLSDLELVEHLGLVT